MNVPAPATVRVLLALLLLASAGGCGGKAISYRCGAGESGPRVDPHTIWSCNRAIAQRVARGGAFSLDELRGVVGFFETLTGISAGVDGTGFGPIPTRMFATSVDRWDDWYAEHRDLLRWDARGAAVVVRNP